MVNFERGVLQGQRNRGAGGYLPFPPLPIFWQISYKPYSNQKKDYAPHITSTKLWKNGVQL